jgi:hypothetical protein
MSDYLEFIDSNVQTFGHETTLLGLSVWLRLFSSLKFNFIEAPASFMDQSDSDKHLAPVWVV